MISLNNVYGLTKNLNVLFIEDDKNFQEETSEIFENLFNRVDLASDGEDGFIKYVNYYKSTSSYYDIVFSDINMPRLNGVDFTKKIYSINESQPIVIISAYSDAKYLLEFVNLGIEQFLVKPFEYERLLKTIYKISNDIQNKNLKKEDEQFVNLTDEYVWDKQHLTLLKNNSVVYLTKNELFLLEAFIKNSSKITTIQEICQLLPSERNEIITISSIKSIISRLRKKIAPLEIENIYGLGYRLNA